MNDDDDIFRLPEDAAPLSGGKSARLDSIKKQRTDIAPDPMRRARSPELRAVEESATDAAGEDQVVRIEDRKGRSFEGKSVDYTIDEILNQKTVATDVTEKDWGQTNKTIPIGWIFMLSALTLTLIGTVVYLGSTSGKAEAKNTDGRQIAVQEQAEESQEAINLVKAIETSVRGYLGASNIEEQLPHVRHPEAIRPRMEKYYANQPITPTRVTSVTNLKPLTLSGRAFWQVVAVTGPKQGQAILLEQLSNDEVKVDWESHVHYQPMPWDQYAVELPTQPMAFRVEVKESPRYFGEFSDQSRWVSYQINAMKSDTLLYCYVLRDSKMHQQINEAVNNGFKRMILRLQASKAISLPNAVVVEAFISADLYRIDPPKTLID